MLNLKFKKLYRSNYKEQNKNNIDKLKSRNKIQIKKVENIIIFLFTATKMKKVIILIVISALVLGGIILVIKNQSGKKTTTSLSEAEKKVSKDLGLEEGKVNVPLYPGATTNEDTCGKDGFYVEGEKSADFVKNYCKFLEKNGWKLNHPDYPTCDDIKSFGGGYNYDKGEEKIAVSVMKYGENDTCYWVNKRSE